MKIAKLNPNPKRLFRSKHRSSVSGSDPLSFGSVSSSASNGVLRAVSGVWSDAVSGYFLCELAEAFRLIDRDNDGIVSVAELEAVLTRLIGAAPTGLEGMAAVFGGDHITVDELANLIGSGIGHGRDTEELREAFAVFDVDGDGSISAEELMRVFEAIGDGRCTLDDCRRMIEGVDRNGNGFVCFEDFSRMMHLHWSGECC